MPGDGLIIEVIVMHQPRSLAKIDAGTASDRQAELRGGSRAIADGHAWAWTRASGSW